jgi:hypothetical protein
MTLIPLTDGCAILGIDPKTLRRWLKLAQMPLHVHPADARIKCLTREQVQQLAAAHARPMELPGALASSALGEPSPLTTPEVPTDAHLVLIHRPTSQPEGDLLSKLSHLETQVAALQQQLAQLALQLLQERTWRNEQRLHMLEALLQPTQKQALQMMGAESQPEEGGQKEQCLPPVHRHARSRVIPLIE